MKKTRQIKYAHSCIWVILMSLHYIIAKKKDCTKFLMKYGLDSVIFESLKSGTQA